MPHIELWGRAGLGPFAPTSRSLTLLHLIGIQFSVLMLSKLKNCPELEEKGQIIHLPGQTIREQIPCFPMTIIFQKPFNLEGVDFNVDSRFKVILDLLKWASTQKYKIGLQHANPLLIKIWDTLLSTLGSLLTDLGSLK